MQPIPQRNPQITNSFREKVQDQVNLFLELARVSGDVSARNIGYIKNHIELVEQDHESFQQNGLDYKSAVIENLLTKSQEFYQNITNQQSTLEDREINLRLIKYTGSLITSIRGIDHPNSTEIFDIFKNAQEAIRLETESSKTYHALNPDGSISLVILISTSLSNPSSINANNGNSTHRASPIITARGISREYAKKISLKESKEH